MSVIRMCALAFLGQRSIAYAAALLVRACLPACQNVLNKRACIHFHSVNYQLIGTDCKMMNGFDSRVWQTRPK